MINSNNPVLAVVSLFTSLFHTLLGVAILENYGWISIEDPNLISWIFGVSSIHIIMQLIATVAVAGAFRRNDSAVLKQLLPAVGMISVFAILTQVAYLAAGMPIFAIIHGLCWLAMLYWRTKDKSSVGV